MKFIAAELPGIVIIEPDVYEDERGWFMESFNLRRFEDGLQRLGLPLPGPFVQDNHSCSKKGVLRGLHYQLEPFAQGKLVSVTQGAAFDVAVDIRPGSPSLGQWFGVELTAVNKKNAVDPYWLRPWISCARRQYPVLLQDHKLL